MNSHTPETRNSLIMRLPDKQDVAAWEQFTAIYQPLIYRLARSKGFQDADAQEVAQEVLVAVSRAIDRWQPDEERGRFRTWLFRIARNMMINFLTRRKHRPLNTGDGEMMKLLEQQCDLQSDESAEFDLEYRREVFRWAADEVRTQVKANTWNAFWMTSVEGCGVEQVADQLQMTVGAVYIARSRVMGRLRSTVARFDLEGGES